MSSLPLLSSDRSLLTGFMMGSEPILNQCQKVQSKVTNTFFSALGIVGRVPYVYPALQYARGSLPLQIVLGGATITCWGALSAWSLVNLGYTKFRPLHVLEQQATFVKRGFCCATIGNLALLFFGITSQIPTASIGYFYTSEWYWPLIMIVADAGFPMYSMQAAFNKARFEYPNFFEHLGLNLSSKEQLSAKTKKGIQKKLKSIEQLLLHADSNTQNQICSKFANAHTLKEAKEVIKLLLELKQAPDEEPGCLYNSCRNIVYLVGLGIPVFRLIWKGRLSFYAGKELHNDLGTIIAIIAISIFPSAYLMFKVTADGCVDTYDRALGVFRKNSPKSTASLRLKTELVFKSFSAILCGIGMISMWQVIEDFVGEDTGLGVSLMLTILPTIYIMIATSSFDFINWIIEEYLKLAGTSDEKSLVRLVERFKRIALLVSEMNEESLTTLQMDLNLGDSQIDLDELD